MPYGGHFACTHRGKVLLGIMDGRGGEGVGGEGQRGKGKGGVPIALNHNPSIFQTNLPCEPQNSLPNVWPKSDFTCKMFITKRSVSNNFESSNALKTLQN